MQVQDAAPSSISPMSITRDREIRRMAVLKTAATFLGMMGQAREDVKSEHVLVLAERWLAWVEQPEQDD